jgi:hypothetical protein
MARFRKKPVEIEAVQFTGDNPQEVMVLADEQTMVFRRERKTLLISTLEGEMTARPGDWVVKGVKGEVYPVKPDIFEATYEAVEEPADA